MDGHRPREGGARGTGRLGAAKNLALALAATGFAASSTPSMAEGVRATVAVASAWLRASPGGAAVVGGYATVTNEGPVPDRIVGATIPGARPGQVHSMETSSGVMRMRRLDGLPLDVGRTVVMRPDGVHFMFPSSKVRLAQGQTVAGTVVFERAGPVPVVFRVGAVGAREAPVR